MRLLAALIGFELSYYLRRISTHVYFLIFFGLGLLMTAIVGGAFKSVAAAVGGSGGIVHANSPLVIAGITGSLGIFAVLIVTAVMGNAVFRDYDAGIHPLFFTTPVPKSIFLAGRFLGAFLVNAWIFLSIPLGLMAGLLLPTLMDDRIGPFRLASYAQPYLLLLLPTLLFTGAIFFSLAAFTRKMLPNYLGGVILLVSYILASNLLGDIENKGLAALLDPFGLAALDVVTEYWTAAERNTLLAPMFSLIGLNRLIWLCMGLGIFALCAWRFRFSHQAWEPRAGGLSSLRKLFATKGSAGIEAAGANVGMGVALMLPTVSRDFTWRGKLAQALSVFRRSFAAIAFNVYFPAIAGAGLLFLVLSAGEVGKIYGTPTWPVTYQVLEILGGTFALFTVIIIAFYVGELVWQERDLKINQVTDTMPSATWSTFLGKLAALVVVVGSLQLVVLAAGIATQLARGFSELNLPLYLKVLLGLNLSEFVLVAVMAFVVHVIVNQKYLGHLVMVLTYFGLGFMGQLGLEHNLYRYNSDPGWQFSDMNQFGPFLMPWGWFKLYWGAIAILMAVLVNVLWVRGQETTPAWRLALARRRFSGSAVGISAAALLLALGAGGVIFWNTNVRNTYRTSFEEQELQVGYEKNYKQYQGIPQPRVVAVQVAAEIFPKTGSAQFTGTYVLRNKTASSIPELHVILPSTADVKELRFIPPATLKTADEDIGYRIYLFDAPLAPDQSLVCVFDLSYSPKGFTNGGLGTAVVENGTFVNSGLMPSFGYSEDGELSDDDTRKKHGLEPKERMAKVDDPVARRDTYISRDSDWVGFEASVTTDADQIAIAPGYLQEDVTNGSRRTFRYAMDAPILNFYSFLSARYAVKKDSWNDVAIEIYYHPGHEYNLDRMISATKKSLDYFTREFGPYQHRQVRILEFPRYATFAQSFPNTIPFSEGIGFIARLDEDTNIDYPFYVTSHEIAHQWWAHQCIGGNVQGSTLLSESMSQYSALMVMEKEYGAAQMRRFLKYELDNYLQGRAFERKKELPLALVENQQYIHYNKGSVVLYALRDYLGEEKMNAAIRGYLDGVKFQEPPYTNSLEFVDAIRAATPPELLGLIDDLFMKISLWDLRAKDATAVELPDGKWKVTLNIDAKKFHADGTGNETEAPLDLPIDVAVFAEGDTSKDDDDVPLIFEKRRIVSGEAALEFIVDKKPARAGIDPYHKLIDRKSDDNVAKVKVAEAPSS